MPTTRAWRAVAAVVITTAAVLSSGALAASASAPAVGAVGKHQHFIGLINGRTGSRFHRVVIKMACFGAIRPGETGHPMGHQTLAVRKVRLSRSVGFTGTGTSIGAFFGAPPPGGRAAGADPAGVGRAPVFVAFHRYVTKMLPRSLVLPCGGKGTVTFVALPLNFRSRSFSVPVTFVGQP